jgi:hypothetical protein
MSSTSANEFVRHQVPMVYNLLHQYMNLFWSGIPAEDLWCKDCLEASMIRLDREKTNDDPSLLVDLATKCDKALGTAWKNKDAKTLFQEPVHPIITFIGGESFYNRLSETERDTIYWQQVKGTGSTCNLVLSLIEACTYVEVFLTDLTTLDMSEMFSSRAKIESSFNGMRRIFDAALPTTSTEPKTPVPNEVIDAKESPHLFLKQQREAREAKAINPLEHLKIMFESMTKDLTVDDYDEFTENIAEMQQGKGELGGVFQGLQSMLVTGNNSPQNMSGLLSKLTGAISGIDKSKGTTPPPDMTALLSQLSGSFPKPQEEKKEHVQGNDQPDMNALLSQLSGNGNDQPPSPPPDMNALLSQLSGNVNDQSPPPDMNALLSQLGGNGNDQSSPPDMNALLSQLSGSFPQKPVLGDDGLEPEDDFSRLEPVIEQELEGITVQLEDLSIGGISKEHII